MKLAVSAVAARGLKKWGTANSNHIMKVNNRALFTQPFRAYVISKCFMSVIIDSLLSKGFHCKDVGKLNH